MCVVSYLTTHAHTHKTTYTKHNSQKHKNTKYPQRPLVLHSYTSSFAFRCLPYSLFIYLDSLNWMSMLWLSITTIEPGFFFCSCFTFFLLFTLHLPLLLVFLTGETFGLRSRPCLVCVPLYSSTPTHPCSHTYAYPFLTRSICLFSISLLLLLMLEISSLFQ